MLHYLEKLDDYKIRINLKKNFPAALEFLSGPVVIYPNEYYAKVGPKGMSSNPVGTGPYKVTSVEIGKRYKFEKFDGYHSGSPKGKASIGKIEVKTIADSNTQLAELFSGGVDSIWKLKTNQTERFSIALLFGDNLPDLVRNKQTVQTIYNQNYNFAKAPDLPSVWSYAGDGYITLYWDDKAEESIDRITGEDFEGYKIYKSSDGYL